jgi:hypothetical protein
VAGFAGAALAPPARGRRGERLARLAADLDTANVGEDFVQLCETALRLCREREMRWGRAIDSDESALPAWASWVRARSTTSTSCTVQLARGERVFGRRRRQRPKVRETTTRCTRASKRAPGQRRGGSGGFPS